jgi:hypothetical protein
MDTISNTTATVALSPLERLRAKVHAAEKEFTGALKTEFEAMYARVDELDEQIGEAPPFDGDEHLRKLLGKLLKGLGEVVETLSDDTNIDDA